MAAVQARVGREHGLTPPSLAGQLLRSAATLVPDLAASISHYVKYNRAWSGVLQPGDAAPEVTLATLGFWLLAYLAAETCFGAAIAMPQGALPKRVWGTAQGLLNVVQIAGNASPLLIGAAVQRGTQPACCQQGWAVHHAPVCDDSVDEGPAGQKQERQRQRALLPAPSS